MKSTLRSRLTSIPSLEEFRDKLASKYVHVGMEQKVKRLNQKKRKIRKTQDVTQCASGEESTGSGDTENKCLSARVSVRR